MFSPEIFRVEENTIFLRYGDNQDLRLSQFGLHLRLFTLEAKDEKVNEVFDKILHIIEPARLTEVEASFSHVHPIDAGYDEARRDVAYSLFHTWIRDRPIRDFAIVWDENVSHDTGATFRAGVVNDQEIIERVARAAGTSEEALRRQTPPWMKVRMPQVALFMQSEYSSKRVLSLDVGRGQVPKLWREWRQRSDQVFRELVGQALPAKKGESS